MADDELRVKNPKFPTKHPTNPAIMGIWLRALETPYGTATPCGSEQDRFTLANQLRLNRDNSGDERLKPYLIRLPENSHEVWVIKEKEPTDGQDAGPDDQGDDVSL